MLWIAALAGVFTLLFQAEEDFIVKEALVVSRGDLPRRIAFSIDAVAERVIKGTPVEPADGEKLVSAGKESQWTAARPGDDGWFRQPSLQNGYLYFVYNSPRDQICLLEASGHSMAYAGGAPRSGDWYQGGYIRRPVALRKGKNGFLLLSQRGGVRAKLIFTKTAASLDPADAIVPDLTAGEDFRADCSIVVHNQSESVAESLKLRITPEGGEMQESQVPPLVPLASRKVAFRIAGAAPASPGQKNYKIELYDSAGAAQGAPVGLSLRVRDKKSTRKVTFVSEIDGSVQYYCINPPSSFDPKQKPGLVLSLHGAAVDAEGQAGCYSSKPNIYIVAPTNRRPYGFDWEDWGRLDALEVLNLTMRELDIDPRRVWLTGHSMGGHGTWQLGALFPDRFAAIAPSAGWVSFFSYAGLRMPSVASGVESIFRRASASSDTLAYANNYKNEGIYILHGDADDNVPVTEARAMREVLAKFHANFSYYERAGAGHWWGNACVDWTPIFEMFARCELPAPENIKDIEFITPSPAVSPNCYFASIEQQQRPFIPSKIKLSLNRTNRAIAGSTENVARFSLDLSTLGAGKLQIDLDGNTIENASVPADGKLSFKRTGDRFEAAPELNLTEKGPHRGGPFKDAFRNRVLFVYGTRGTPEENAWSLQKSRFDAEIFQYSGNGSIEITADVKFNAAAEPDRNIIIYGNAITNSAFDKVIVDCPIVVTREGVDAAGERFQGGDHGFVMIRPRKGSDRASVGVVGGSGIVGMRLTDRLPYFTSGVAYPDFTIFGPDPKDKEKFTILRAGFFGNDWKIESGDAAK